MSEPDFSLSHFLSENGGASLYYDCCTWHDCMTPQSGPFLMPLWFVRDLMLVCLFSPIIYYSIHYMNHIYLLIITFLFLFVLWPDIHGFGLSAWFFFSWGAYWSIHKRNFVSDFKRVRIYSYLLVVFLLLLELHPFCISGGMSKRIFPLYIIIAVVSVVNLASQWLELQGMYMAKILSQSSFFIFCAHHVCLIGLSIKIVSLLFGDVENECFAQLLMLILSPLLVVLFCLFAFIILKRYFPRVLNILVGNRF